MYFTHSIIGKLRMPFRFTLITVLYIACPSTRSVTNISGQSTCFSKVNRKNHYRTFYNVYIKSPASN